MDGHVWECMVHLHPGVGPLPALWYDRLKYPVVCTSYREQLVFRGPLDGSGGVRSVLSAAKLAIGSYIQHGNLQGVHQVSQPIVYKMVRDSEVAWDDVDGITHGDFLVIVKPEQEEGESEPAPSQEQPE